MGFLYDNFIADFFLLALRWLFSLVNDYSIAIILMTIAMRAILLPLDLNSRKNSRKMVQIQPEMAELQKRYANNPQLMQKKQKELYAEYGYKPSAGCLPMLLQLPIFFAFFGAMRVLVSEQTIQLFLRAAEEGAANVQLPQWLWVHNFWQPDSGFASILPKAADFISTLTANSQAISPQQLHILQQAGLIDFTSGTLTCVTQSYDALTAGLLSGNNLTGYANGWFLLPVLSGVVLFFQQKLTQKAGLTQQSQQNALMTWIFPLFTVYICITSNTAFALYWTASNVYALGQQAVMMLIERHRYNKNKPKIISEVVE